MELEGRNDVDPNNRGLRISDPALGVVVVPWEHLRTVRFHESAGTSGERAGFGGGRLLAGTVVTREGEELRGELRWDADEAGSWELLDGEAGGIRYEIELGFVRRIVPDGEEGGARVSLLDGRTLELTGSRDVGPDNKGVMVASTERPEAEGGGRAWRLIPWSDVEEVRFEPEPAASWPSGGPMRGAEGAGLRRVVAGRRARSPLALACLCLLTALPRPARPAQAQEVLPLAEDAFVDPDARALFRAAQANWRSVEQSVLRYQAVIRQRISAKIRAPLKDRVLYRDETAVRAFWDHEHDAVVQVLGARSQYPGQETARSEGQVDWLDDLAFDEPFDPGGDRLFFGGSGIEFGSGNAVEHPLAAGADRRYRYASGDTLTLSLGGGRRLSVAQLDVLPREADVRLITGTLWIEPESGALVRAVYRLSRQLDLVRDLDDLQEEEEEGSFRLVPGVLKPWTFDLSMIAVDYSLWDFEVWLPRYMRAEGQARAGVVRLPIEMDVSYRMESVTTRADVERTEAAGHEEEPPPGPRVGPELVERHFETRAEAMAFVARLLSEEDGVEYESAEESDFARDRDAFIIAPRERSLVRVSPELPPPIWEDAAGFRSEEEVGEYFRALADLPAPDVPGVPWSLDWGLGGPGLLRYNRVEGLAAGTGLRDRAFRILRAEGERALRRLGPPAQGPSRPRAGDAPPALQARAVPRTRLHQSQGRPSRARQLAERRLSWGGTRESTSGPLART